jgi:hypothetical protein
MKLEEYSAARIYIQYARQQYNLHHIVTMINTNKRYSKDWLERCLLEPLLEGKLAFHPYMMQVKNPEYKRRIIETVCLKQIGGGNDT